MRVVTACGIRSFVARAIGTAALLCLLPAGPGMAAEIRHWAFEAVRPAGPPEVRGTGWVRNPIDRFILSGLEARGLGPAVPATREEFIRRVSLGIVGLPPTPAEIDAFVDDTADGAEERLADRLLDSPHYGERWARHWLDLVRYAESDGFEHDALRPHAWLYRDYVIRAFNDDKPYDQFAREQVAGDELRPGDADALTATAFNLLGPDMVDSADQVQRRFNTLNDATDTTASVFLGLTFGCARCHQHKFEPISQRDYFSWQAFYAPAEFVRDLPIPTGPDRAAHEAAMVQYRAESGATQRQLDALEGPYREKLRESRLARLSEDARMAHRTPKEQRTPEQEGTVAETAPMLKFGDGEVADSMTGDDRIRRDRLIEALKRIAKPTALPATMALRNKAGPVPRTFVLARGDYLQPGEEVSADFPAAVRGVNGAGRRTDVETAPGVAAAAGGSRRAVLAEWIASPANPLTSRVMVNRIWQHHFGRGLVATPSDFGTRGARPTHPGLLDWLAGEFVARGWSVKALHRLILASAAYRQSSEATVDVLARDPENRLFSRQNRVRLEGEVVRDALLAISGRLNARVGGPAVSPPISPDLARTSGNWTTSPETADHTRRSVYILARRNLRFPFLEVFDAPDSNLSCPERGRSTTAPQALTLLNSEEVMLAADGLARRLSREAGSEAGRIDLAFRLTLGRGPTVRERFLTHEFLESSRLRLPNPAEPLAAWRELGRALFNLNAFVHVD